MPLIPMFGAEDVDLSSAKPVKTSDADFADTLHPGIAPQNLSRRAGLNLNLRNDSFSDFLINGQTDSLLHFKRQT